MSEQHKHDMTNKITNTNEMKLKKKGMKNYMWHESSPLFDK